MGSNFWLLVRLSLASMSILSQPHHNPLLKSSFHSGHHHHQCLPMRVYCSSSSTTTTTKFKYNPQQPLVMEPPPPPLPPRLTTLPPPPPTSTNHRRIILDDPNLQSTWSHRAWMASGCTTVAISLVKCVTAAANSHIWLEPVLAGLVGYILADLGSGVYHWAIDNYGDDSTPIFGSQIEAFQGHHKFPWTITKRQFANNLHALARVMTFIVLPIDLAFHDPILHGFVAVFTGCIMFSQQFHSWAHGTKSRLPPAVVALQDAGVLVSRLQHAAHHRPPYNNNYCIVSGVWNGFLDKYRVFETLEMVVFFKLGVKPRSWDEPNCDWTQEETETETETEIETEIPLLK